MADKKRILVVGSDRSRRSLIARHLEEDGYRVAQVLDGMEVLVYIRRGQQFDSIISEMSLPKLSGLELLRQLRAGGDQTPFVLMSGEMDPSDLERACKNLKATLLLKPVDYDTMIKPLLPKP